MAPKSGENRAAFAAGSLRADTMYHENGGKANYLPILLVFKKRLSVICRL